MDKVSWMDKGMEKSPQVDTVDTSMGMCKVLKTQCWTLLSTNLLSLTGHNYSRSFV